MGFAGAGLALPKTATTMLRVPVLAIVLTLAIGPHASTLCHALCGGDGPVHECHETLAKVVAAGCCDRSATSLTAVVDGDVRVQTFAPAAEAGAIQHHVDAEATSAGLFHRERPRVSHAHLLVTVLRI